MSTADEEQMILESRLLTVAYQEEKWRTKVAAEEESAWAMFAVIMMIGGGRSGSVEKEASDVSTQANDDEAKHELQNYVAVLQREINELRSENTALRIERSQYTDAIAAMRLEDHYTTPDTAAPHRFFGSVACSQ